MIILWFLVAINEIYLGGQNLPYISLHSRFLCFCIRKETDEETDDNLPFSILTNLILYSCLKLVNF